MNTFKAIATLLGVAGVSTLFSLSAKAQVNPNPSIFSEYPYRANIAQATPGTTPGTVQQDNRIDDNGVQRINTNGVTQPVQDTTTPGTFQQDNDNNDNDGVGVRALW
ncbi:MAG: hypothetical protein ACFCUV_22130 [Rivularia sp. (in: cyanobacteria)]